MKGKNVISDARVGGEKLVYQRVSYSVQVIKPFNLFTVMIPLLLYRNINGKIELKKETTKVAYLRPYKKNWAPKKDRLPFHEWGKKEHPLTNIWVELEFDYKDIVSQMPIIKSRVEDQSLIKFLRQHEEKFTVIN